MIRSLMVASALAIGLALPAAAQQSSNLHYYLTQFEWKDSAVKSLTENPQDRTAVVRKLFEAHGGKLDNYFMIAGTNSGIVIGEFPDTMAVEAVTLETLASGALQKLQMIPLLTTEEARQAMQMVKDTKSGYTPPAMTGSTTPPAASGTSK